MGRTGLSAQIGIGEETTPGVAVAVSRFFEFVDESHVFNREKIKGKGLRAGSRKHANKWVDGRRGGEGPVTFELQPNGMGIVPKWCIGGSPVTTTPDHASAYLHTTKEGDLDGKALTVQFGRPGSDGTVVPFTYSGCKVASWELSMSAPDGVLMLALTLDSVDETTDTALATASYASSNVLIPFSHSSNAISIGGTTYDVKQVTLSGNNSLKTDRNKIGSATKLEQVEGAEFRDYTGTIDRESFAGTAVYDLFTEGTEVEIISTFYGGEIGSTGVDYMFRCTLPRCIITGTTPNVGGPDLLEHQVPFEVLDTSDSDTACKMEVYNADASA